MGGGAEQLAALMERVRPRLVVLDTLTALIKGGGKRRGFEDPKVSGRFQDRNCGGAP